VIAVAFYRGKYLATVGKVNPMNVAILPLNLRRNALPLILDSHANTLSIQRERKRTRVVLKGPPILNWDTTDFFARLRRARDRRI
jgi:hypothetical protein